MVEAIRSQPTPPPATARPELDAVLQKLAGNATSFARSSVTERIHLLRQIQQGCMEQAEASVRACWEVKGIDPSSEAALEDWSAGPQALLRSIRLMIATLERIEAGRPAVDPSRVRTRADGRAVVDAFPVDLLDSLMWGGFRGEIWMKKGLTAEEVVARAAPHYQVPAAERRGKVVLVLGAGNVSSIPPMDALQMMFGDGAVCLVKMNPVNAFLGPFIEKGFQAAVDRGLFAVVYGAGDVGEYLCRHDRVDAIHITGSEKTFDQIVWGPPGPEREARKARKDPLLKKPITSELGNVSPVIVVPGPYTEAEMTVEAGNICFGVTQNASYNCSAAKMLVTGRGWEGRPRLMDAIARTLERVPTRKAYYPGAPERFKDLVGSHPKARTIGQAPAGHLPWGILPDLDPADASERAFHVEPFCSLVSETAVGSADPVAFLEAAVKFCQERLWGTLCCALVVHPKVRKDPAVAAAVEKAIDELPYGTVSVNQWMGIDYALSPMPWGGHPPSSTPEDIQSGTGWVHNTLFLDGIEKGVLRGPFIFKPKAPWLPGNKTAHLLGRKVYELEATHAWAKLPGVVWTLMRG